MDSNTYFAALPTEEIARELSKRCDNWYNSVKSSGLFGRMKKSYMTYYGLSRLGGGTSSEIVQGGVQGELSLMKINHFRNLVGHTLNMTVASRPAMEARAINTDARSLAQTVLANGILDYYMREKKLERYLKKATELALIFGESFLRLEWDPSLGDEFNIDPETGRMVYTGDLQFSTINTLDVIKDVYQDDPENHEWLIVRHFKNKHDLIAKYPEYADDILSLATRDSIDYEVNFYRMNGADKSDLIPVYEFYHRKSDALPDGRQVVFLSADVVLFDGPLPYRDIPIYRIAPGDFLGTTYGYSTAFDLLGIQEALDALYSVVITNQATFGVQNILLPKGHGLSVTQLSGGLNLLEYDNQVGKPESLNLTQTPSEIFNFINKLEQTQETISGVNSVARGNPEASLRSGNALALVQSMAIQFNSGLQQSYAQLIEDVGTAVVNTLKDFAAAPRIVAIVGRNNRTLVKEFTGADLDKINRVVVDLGNPLSKTTSGRVEMAENLLQKGLIKTPQEYFTVIKTGNLDTLIEGQTAEIQLVRQENERLSEGKSARAIITDDHKFHIQEHKSVLASVDMREDNEYTRKVQEETLAHIQEHINLLRSGDPNLLMMLGEQPLQQMQQAPQEGGQPAPQGEKVEGTPSMQEVMASPEGGLQEAQDIAAPNMPTNPLTGETWDPSTGGL